MTRCEVVSLSGGATHGATPVSERESSEALAGSDPNWVAQHFIDSRHAATYDPVPAINEHDSGRRRPPGCTVRARQSADECGLRRARNRHGARRVAAGPV